MTVLTGERVRPAHIGSSERANRLGMAPWPAGAASRIAAILFCVVLITLPITCVDMGALAGDLGMNLVLPFFLLLTPFVVLRMLPFPLKADVGGPYEFLARGLTWFFAWCAFTTVLTGVLFEANGVTASGVSPLAHSLARFPVPLVLSLMVAVSYHAGLRLLSKSSLDLILCIGAGALGCYGLIQIYALHNSPSWYFSIVHWLEAARRHPGPWAPDVLSYIHLTGRVNLTTFEAAEAARLLLIVYIPVLATPQNGKPGLGRSLLILLLVSLIIAAQTVVGLACLCMLVIVGFAALKGRMRLLLGSAVVLLVVIAILTMPNQFSERLQGIAQSTNVAEIDQSVLTRASFAVASLRVALQQPILGIGWSKEMYFLKDAVPAWGYSWEVQHSLETGEALAAKSMAIRLLLYSGIPAFCLMTILFCRTALTALQDYSATRRPMALRVFLVLIMFAVGGTLDGGILVGAYSWIALGVALGVAARPDGQSGAGTVEAV
jgi:O-antigen ligase